MVKVQPRYSKVKFNLIKVAVLIFVSTEKLANVLTVAMTRRLASFVKPHTCNEFDCTFNIIFFII